MEGKGKGKKWKKGKGRTPHSHAKHEGCIGGVGQCPPGVGSGTVYGFRSPHMYT